MDVAARIGIDSEDCEDVLEHFSSASYEGRTYRHLSDPAHGLGESTLLPMVETLRAVERGEPVGERHTVRGADAELDALLAHLREMGLQVEIEADELEDGERVVTFRKTARSTLDTAEHYLAGGIVRE